MQKAVLMRTTDDNRLPRYQCLKIGSQKPMHTRSYLFAGIVIETLIVHLSDKNRNLLNESDK